MSLDKMIGIGWIKWAIIPALLIIAGVFITSWFDKHDQKVIEARDLNATVETIKQVKDDVKNINRTDTSIGTGSIIDRVLGSPRKNSTRQNGYSRNSGQAPDAIPEAKQLPRYKANGGDGAEVELLDTYFSQPPPSILLPECTDQQIIDCTDGCCNG